MNVRNDFEPFFGEIKEEITTTTKNIKEDRRR